MTAADLVAALRALAVIPIVWAIAADQTVVALAVFVVAALSDALDGFLARRAANQSARGALLDPLADKILVVGTLVALAAVGRGWPVTVVAVFVTAREGPTAALRWLAYRRGISMPADMLAKLKTVTEMAGLALIIVDGRPWAVLGTGIVGVAFLLGLYTLPHYLPSRVN